MSQNGHGEGVCASRLCLRSEVLLAALLPDHTSDAVQGGGRGQGPGEMFLLWSSELILRPGSFVWKWPFSKLVGVLERLLGRFGLG